MEAEQRKQGRPKKPSASQPNLRVKGTEGFRHDLFKLKPAEMLKNQSFKKGRVQIEKVEHTHFFHTFDSNGKAQEFSTPTGGHFHEISWEVDDSGDLQAKCGPAMQYVYKKLAGRQRKKIAEIKWNDEEMERIVVDDHTHECEYRWSEELSSETVRRRRQVAVNMAERDIAAKNQAKSLGMESGI